jgi:hypothetical protein
MPMGSVEKTAGLVASAGWTSSLRQACGCASSAGTPLLKRVGAMVDLSCCFHDTLREKGALMIDNVP